MSNFKKTGGFPRKSFGARPSYGNKRGPVAFGGRASGAPTERFQATCNECRKICEVPFRPNGKKPVYCRYCFKGKEDAPSYGGASTFRKGNAAPADFSKQFDILNAKLDRLIRALER